jgi:hypothetical protein
VRWAADRFGVAISSKAGARQPKGRDEEAQEDEASGDGAGSEGEYATLADLYVAAEPSVERDKVLVASYWHQVLQNKPDFTSYEVNKDLKDLGHGVGSINKVFTVLMDQKPQLIVQVKKSGTAKQGRKRYKLTKAGIDQVHAMVE